MDTINLVNNGKPYFFRLDIAKESGQIARFTDWIKTRVSDNGKKVPIQWYDQGTVMNVHGFYPFIEGGVGKWIKDDDTGELVPSTDVVYRTWQGTPADTSDNGIAYYTLEDQFFTKQGEFVGTFGLRDDNGNNLTSVNLVFSVLGNDLRLTQAKDYYIKDLENLKRKFENDGDQAVKDFNAKIEAGTETDRQALDALRASIQANRDEQANLTNRLVGTSQQIKLHDVVTRPEFQNGIEQIKKNATDAISKVTSGTPKPIKDLATLKATYPNGDNGFYVTRDSGHKYAFVDGTWQDFGVYQATAMPQEDQAKLDSLVDYHTMRNLIPNSDFSEGMNHWYTSLPLTGFIDKSMGKNIVVLNSHELTADGWGSITSERINVIPGQRISAAISYKWSPDDANVDGASLCINFYDNADGNGERLNYVTVEFGETSEFVINKLENILVPDGAKSARLMVQAKRNGTITFYRPILVRDSIVEGYVPESMDLLHRSGSNLLVDSNFAHKDAYWHTDPTAKTSFRDYYQGSSALSFETHGNSSEQWKAFFSNTFSITPRETLRWSSLIKWIPDDSTTDKLVITLNFFSSIDTSKRISYQTYTLTNAITDWKQFDDSNISVPENASTANIMFQIVKNGVVSICRPEISNKIDLNSSNLIKDSEFNDETRWYNNSEITVKTDHGFNGHNVRTIEGHGQQNAVYYTDESQKIKVDGGNSIDAYITVNFTPDVESSDTAVLVVNEYRDFDNSTSRSAFKSFTVENTNNEFVTVGIRNYRLKDDTKYVSLMLQNVKNGCLKYANPIIRYHKFTKEISDNDAFDMDLSDNIIWSYIPKWYQDKDGYQIYSSDNSNHAFCVSDKIKVGNATSVSALADMLWQPVESKSIALMVINYWDKNGERISFEQNKNTHSGATQMVKLDNCIIPNNAVEISIQFELTGPGRLYFTKPKLVLRDHVSPDLDDKVAQYDSKTDIPIVSLFGDISGMNKDEYKLLRFDYQNGNQHITGYADTKWQGDSSLNFAKKNFRIKLYQDNKKENKLKISPQATWQPESKFNLKANFADATMARNIINSRIAGEVTATRAGLPDEIIKAPNFATVDGFPIHLYINSVDNGIYTFNLTKYNFGNAKNGVSSVSYCNETLFNADSAKFDGTDYEALTDVLTDDGKTSFNNLLRFVHTSTDDDFVKQIDNYISISSVIDYLIVNNVIGGLDCWGKNTEYVTYDNQKWYCLFYDLDISYGSTWNGSVIDTNSLSNHILYSAAEGDNLLYKRTSELFANRVKERYTKLRSWLTPRYIILKYKKFMDNIGESNYKRDQSLWNTTSKDLYTFKQLQEYIYKRFEILDDLWLQDNQEEFADIKARLTNLEHGTTK